MMFKVMWRSTWDSCLFAEWERGFNHCEEVVHGMLSDYDANIKTLEERNNNCGDELTQLLYDKAGLEHNKTNLNKEIEFLNEEIADLKNKLKTRERKRDPKNGRFVKGVKK